VLKVYSRCDLAVRYEDLTTDPEQVTGQVCRYLGVDWTPAMLDYGATQQGPFF
jgi:sulfotransferase family protein